MVDFPRVLECQILTAGVVIKRQPSEQEELPGPLPAQTEGQPIQEESKAAVVDTTEVKAEAKESTPHKGSGTLKTENGNNVKSEDIIPAEAKGTAASQQEELSLRPWASPSTPPSEYLWSFCISSEVAPCNQKWHAGDCPVNKGVLRSLLSIKAFTALERPITSIIEHGKNEFVSKLFFSKFSLC